MAKYESKHVNTMALYVGKYRISIIWGPGTYSDNHWADLDLMVKKVPMNSNTAELAILRQPETNTPKDFATRRYTYCGGDSVAGYLSVDEVVVIIGKVALRAKDKELLAAIKTWKPMTNVYQLKEVLEAFSDTVINSTCRPIYPALESPK
jgi:hypothetical protein